MHEFSIALNIVEIVSEEALKARTERISGLVLEIGQASGVVKEALEFALESAVKNTVLADAKIVINEIKSVAECNICHSQYETDSPVSVCPNCGEITSRLISGRELKIKSITL